MQVKQPPLTGEQGVVFFLTPPLIGCRLATFRPEPQNGTESGLETCLGLLSTFDSPDKS